jgi:hypothetical protein
MNDTQAQISSWFCRSRRFSPVLHRAIARARGHVISTDAGCRPHATHYTRFFTDSFNYAILWATIVLGVK